MINTLKMMVSNHYIPFMILKVKLTVAIKFYYSVICSSVQSLKYSKSPDQSEVCK